MIRLLPLAALVVISTVASPNPQRAAPASRDAPAIIADAIQAMGGEKRLTSLRTLRIDAIGHAWALEQSERPEGPWLATYTLTLEVRDLSNRRLRRQLQRRNWSFPQWANPSAVVASADAAARSDGSRWVPGSRADLTAAAESLALGPERLLLTARAAADVRPAPARTLHGVPQDAVAFTWNGWPITLYFNGFTHFPTMLELVREDTLGIWGDVTERRWYSWWSLEKGLWYPRQTTVEWNGLPFSDTSVMELAIDEPIDQSQLTIPSETAKAFAAAPPRTTGLAALRLDSSKAVEMAPNVIQLPGPWNVLLVRQPDGVVIIEGPISSQYTEDVIGAAGKLFPGAAVKAVVTTSDAWPHIGGMREYVARRIPVYALDLNVPIVERLAKAPRTKSPDALARAAVVPVFRPVAARTTIGSGDTQIDLIPVRGEMGERMMIAWLPAQGVVYTSDLVQRARRSGFFMPGMLDEVIRAVAREKLGTPERAVGMHLGPTPWAEIVAAVNAAYEAR